MPARKILFSALLGVLFLWGISYFFASPCLAAVVINEIMYDLEGSDDGHEWIEIYNPGGNVDLTNWKLREGGTDHSLNIKQGNVNLDTGNYAIIADNADIFLSDNPGFSSTLFDSSFSLSNDGESLVLKNESGEENSVSYSKDWGGGNGYSLERSGTVWKTGPKKGTPGQINSQETDSPSPSPSPSSEPESVSYPGNIYLSEFMACPSEGNEWVEIYNDNDSSVNLSGWFIGDNTDNGKRKFSADIGGKSYHKVEFGSGFLNNSGDNVRLLNPQSEIESHTYSECDSSYTWSKVNGSWCKTDQSPGSANNSCKEENNEDSDPSPSPSNTIFQSSQSPPPKPSPSPKTAVKSQNTKSSPSPDQPDIKLMEYADVLGEQDENKEEEQKKSLFQSKLFFPIVLSLAGLLFISASLYPQIEPKIRPKLLKLLGKK